MRRPFQLSISLVAGSLALALSGCAPAVTTPPAESGNKPDAGNGADAPVDGIRGEATVNVDGREFSFRLSTCVIYDDEIELGGLGSEVGSAHASYLEGGLSNLGPETYGEVRIDIGADGPHQSTDDFIALGSPADVGFSVVADGNEYLATGGSWGPNGEDLGASTLAFTCS